MSAPGRAPIEGRCIDVDGASWHKDGQRCEDCGFGIDRRRQAKTGFWGEPIVELDVAAIAIEEQTTALARVDGGEGVIDDDWFPESEFVRFPGAWVRRVEPDNPIAPLFAAVDPRLILPRQANGVVTEPLADNGPETDR